MQRTLKRELKVLEIAKREAVGPSTSGGRLPRPGGRGVPVDALSASVARAGTRRAGGNAALNPPRLKPRGCAARATEGKWIPRC
jgi:hypothetical protein